MRRIPRPKPRSCSKRIPSPPAAYFFPGPSTSGTPSSSIGTCCPASLLPDVVAVELVPVLRKKGGLPFARQSEERRSIQRLSEHRLHVHNAERPRLLLKRAPQIFDHPA